MLRKKRRIATGIDIGSEAIKIAQVKRDRNGLILSNWTIINIQEHLKGNKLTQLLPKHLSDIVKTELAKIGLSVVNPSIATSAEDVLFKYFFIPKSVGKRIISLLRLIVSPIPTPELIFGFCRINRVSRLKKNDLVMIGLARDNVLDFMHRFHEGLGGDAINHAIPRPLAIYNLVTYIKGEVDGELYFCANIGGETIDMAIMEKTNPDRPVNRPAFFRSVPFKALQDNQELSFIRKPGNLEVNKKVGDPAMDISGTQWPSARGCPLDNTINRAVYDEIQQTIVICQRELKLHGLDIRHFLLTGERGDTEGLPQYLSERLGKDVHVLDLMGEIGLRIGNRNRGSLEGDTKDRVVVAQASSLHKTDEQDNLPACMATAIGLALGMLSRLPVYIKLEPRIIETEKRRGRKLSYLKAAMAVALVAAVMSLYHGYHTMKVYRDNAVKAEEALTLYVNNESKLLGTAEGQRRLGEQLWKLKNVSSRDFSKEALIRFLGMETPQEIVIKGVDIVTVGGVQFLGSARWVRLEGEIKVEGNGANPLELIKGYVTRLEGIEGFSRVQFREIKELGEQAATFQIEFVIDS